MAWKYFRIQNIKGDPIQLWRGGKARLRRFPAYLAVLAVEFLIMAVAVAIFMVLSLSFSQTGLIISMILMTFTIFGLALFLQFAPMEAALNWQSGTKKCLRVSAATVRSHFFGVLGVGLMLALIAVIPIALIALSVYFGVWLMAILMTAFLSIYFSYSQLVLARVFSQWRVEPSLKNDSAPFTGELEELSEPA